MSRVRKPTETRAPIVRFLALCVAYWAAALVVLSRLPVIERFGIDVTVWTVSKTFALLGQRVQRVGDSIYAGGQGVSIVADCSPHVPYLIFAAVVLAFPSTWRQRLLGLLCGAFIIHVFNTVRIIVLIQILIWKPRWFEFAHVYLWQTGTVLVLFATFALWLKWLGGPRSSSPATAAA
jgi:exosortase/archaeosortase family protein